MMTYIIIELATNLAVNFVTHQGEDFSWVPEGHKAIRHDGPWGMGWIWDGEKLTDPNPPPPPEPMKSAPDAPTPGTGITTV